MSSYSSSKKRKDSRTVPSCPIESMYAWLNEILVILDRPSVAIAMFIIGVGFIMVSSRQVKMGIDLLESSGMVNAGKVDAVLGNLLSLVVFFLVWINIIILSHLKVLTMIAFKSCCWWLTKLVVISKRVYEEDVDDTQPPPQQYRSCRSH